MHKLKLMQNLNLSDKYAIRFLITGIGNMSLRVSIFRFCVDLRPLNERIVKQKYPFPLIEDCLARLGNKSVFILLDLKDGLHLSIKIHPDYQKYFAFAHRMANLNLHLPFG